MNPKLGASLSRLDAAVSSAISQGPGVAPAQPTLTPQRRARHGAIERAVLDVLVDASDPMQVTAIHIAVEKLLGVDVSYSSIKNAASRLANYPSQPISRVSAGVYGHSSVAD